MKLFVFATVLLLVGSVANAGKTPKKTKHKAKCLSSVPIKRATTGTNGEYKVKVGLESKGYSGFINRKKVKPTEKCMFREAEPGQITVMWVSAPSFKKHVRYNNNIQMQCVFQDDGTLLEEYSDLPTVGVPSGKDLLIKCGSDEKYDCDDGGNNIRNTKYRKMMEKKKLTPLYFYVRPNNNMDSAAARLGKWNGRKVFCQAYVPDKKASLFGLEFSVGPSKQ